MYIQHLKMLTVFLCEEKPSKKISEKLKEYQVEVIE